MTRRGLFNAVVASAIAVCAIAAPARAAAAYTPTMADVMSINAALHRYVVGLDNWDGAKLASAFTEDGVFQIYDHGRLAVNRRGRREVAEFRTRPAPGAQSPAGAPPPAAQAPKPILHFITNDAWDYRSATRVDHFAYWLDVTPGEGQTSSLGHSGHYEDVMVKLNGEWLLQERKVIVGAD